jgi:hypothetical protein
LDFQGRPTLSISRGISGKGVQKNLKVTYDFENKSLLKKPLLLFSSFLVFFLTLIVGKRLNLKTLNVDEYWLMYKLLLLRSIIIDTYTEFIYLNIWNVQKQTNINVGRLRHCLLLNQAKVLAITLRLLSRGI